MNETDKDGMRAATLLAIQRLGGVGKVATIAGVSVQSVYRWRNGEVIISAENAARIAAACGLTLEDFRPDLGEK